METNHFSRKIESKSTEDLQDILADNVNRTDDYVLATLWELEKRESIPEQYLEIFDRLKTKQLQAQEKSEYESHYIPPDLPPSIKIAAYLLYSVLVVELIGILILSRTSFIGFNSLILPGSFVTALTGFFIHRGKLWVRYLFYAVFAFSTLFFIITITSFDIISITQQVIMSTALVYLLKKESRNWYKIKTAP